MRIAGAPSPDSWRPPHAPTGRGPGFRRGRYGTRSRAAAPDRPRWHRSQASSVVSRRRTGQRSGEGGGGREDVRHGHCDGRVLPPEEVEALSPTTGTGSRPRVFVAMYPEIEWNDGRVNCRSIPIPARAGWAPGPRCPIWARRPYPPGVFRRAPASSGTRAPARELRPTMRSSLAWVGDRGDRPAAAGYFLLWYVVQAMAQRARAALRWLARVANRAALQLLTVAQSHRCIANLASSSR